MHGRAVDDNQFEVGVVQDLQDFRKFLHFRGVIFLPVVFLPLARRISKDRAIEAKDRARSVGVRSKFA